MNNDSQIFSLSRYLLLLKCHLVENRKSLLTLCAVMWGVLTLTCIKMCKYTPHNSMDQLQSEWAIMSFWAMIFACMSGSIMFSTMKTKIGRIRVLMRPASMAEKFAVNFTVYALFFAIAYIIGWGIADGIRAMVNGGQLLWSAHVIGIDSKAIFIYTLLVLFMQSVFALGSALWPKRSFTKTFLCIFLVMLFLLFGNWNIFRVLNHFDTYFGLCALLILFTIGVYTLAWFRFRNIQITQRFLS